ncbi:MAG: PQQ-binding-like beta-propeller repeat protein, partial [Planctomycetota bacterium]|nr:PQQ-binding-like beta-propeller repeat protein [Planctomycetota bacterium]
ARVLVEGEAVPAAELGSHPLLQVAEGDIAEVDTDEWPVTGGDRANARVSDDLPREIPRTPLWRKQLRERDARFVLDTRLDGVGPANTRWRIAAPDRARGATPARQGLSEWIVLPYPTVRPVVARNRVLYKDYRQVCIRSVSSGVWISGRDHRSWPSLEDETTANDARPESGTKRGKIYEAYYRFLDYGGNRITVHGDALVFVGNEQVYPELKGRYPNALEVNSLSSKKLLWAWQHDLYATKLPLSLLEEWKEDHRRYPDVFFRGPGLTRDGLLYTVVDHGEAGTYLWGIQIDDSRVRFRTFLHGPDEVPNRIPIDASLAIAGGVVYVVTNSGVVAAVEAAPPGKVRWLRRYKREYQAGRPANWRRRSTARLTQRLALNDPIVAGGRVIVAPADGHEVFALHANTGELAWRYDLSDGGAKVAYVVGVSRGAVVLAGRDIMALDLTTAEPLGKVLWGPTRVTGTPFGRGFVGRRFAYVPLIDRGRSRSAIARYSLKGGGDFDSAQDLFWFDVERLGNLVHVGGRLIVANDDEVMCFTAPEAELKRLDARIAAGGPAAPLLTEKALTRLASGAGDRRERAREDLNAAIAAPSDSGASLRLRGLAIENLLQLALQKQDLEPLEEAQTLAHEPAFQAQILFTRARVLAGQQRPREAIAVLEKLGTEYAHVQVVRQGQARFAPQAVGRALETWSRQPQFGEVLPRIIRERIADAVERQDVEALRALPQRMGFLWPCEESLLAAARIYSQRGEDEAAERELRAVLRDFDNPDKDKRYRVEAHLRLALSLAGRGQRAEAELEREDVEQYRRGNPEAIEANQELYDQVISVLVEGGRRPRTVDLLPQPLARHKFELAGAVAVPVRGGVPASFLDTGGAVLVERAGGYVLARRDGEVLWEAQPPQGYQSPGPPDDLSTLAVAAAVARHRLAQRDGLDLILADVNGIVRIDGRKGTEEWRIPGRKAGRLLAALRSDVRKAQATAFLERRNRLPRFVLEGNLLLRFNPDGLLEAFDAATGDRLWSDETRGATIGTPAVQSGLVVAAWADPPLIKVFRTDGGERSAYTLPSGQEGRVLVAPPLLDRSGRLFLMACPRKSADPNAVDTSKGSLLALKIDSGEWETRWSQTIESRRAALAYTDGKTLVYFDNMSVHFVDLTGKDEKQAIDTDKVLEILDVVRGGDYLFVATYRGLAVAREGARVYRLHLPSRRVRTYAPPPNCRVYAPMLLTREFLILPSCATPVAHLTIYKRHPPEDDPDPRSDFAEVFAAADGARSEDELVVKNAEGARFDVPPAVVLMGKGLLLTTPFGTFHLRRLGD